MKLNNHAYPHFLSITKTLTLLSVNYENIASLSLSVCSVLMAEGQVPISLVFEQQRSV